MSAVLATVVLTVEELASLANALSTLQTLAQKIQGASPDAWAAVSGDFGVAVKGWEQAVVAVAPRGTVPAVVAGGAVYNDASSANVHVQDVTPHKDPEAPAQAIPADVKAIVEASGQLPGMPVGSDAAPPTAKPAEETQALTPDGDFRIDD